MRATIKSIAKDLNVSHMTVSRALSGHPGVKPSTRDAIQTRAHELGYVRSSAAGAMRGDPTGIVGLLLPNIVNEFYSRFANALSLLCADRGFDLVIHLTNDEAARERQSLLRLQALQASAVIMVPTPALQPDLAPFPHGMRVIELIRTRRGDDGFGRLMIDDGPTITAAVNHLVARGCRRIAFIGASATLSSGLGRVMAFRQGLERSAIPEDPALIRTAAPGFDMGRREMDALLDASLPPDAVICGGFEISNGALDACLRRDIRAPEDLAFIGYGDPAPYQWIAGGITTIRLSADDIAQNAIEFLESDKSGMKINSSTQLVIRKSA